MRKVIFAFVILYPLLLSAQEVQLFETVNYQFAVRNGTRSRDGKPGPKYWQNHADYNISVRLDTARKRIFGQENVTYYNQSPDTLTNIVLRLYQNKYKKGAIRDMEVHSGNIHEGMELDQFKINGTGISVNNDRAMWNGTNLSIPLKNPLPPGSKLSLYCEWNYKLPLEPEFRRTGYYKDEAWFIGYFYLQIAVYDDMEISPMMKGWDYMLFHKGVQEFYNDFNDYKVTIEVPEGFYVWATGRLTNAEEVYPNVVLERLHKARSEDDQVEIISKDDLNKDLLQGSIWKFEVSNVTDFGFGTARRYLWEGTSVPVDDRRVFVDVAYFPGSLLYPQVLDIARKTIEYGSGIFPGIPFPYDHATTFNGMLSGGMEFPMIANNCDINESTFMILMTFHEICHNYLPFMMGINEKRYHFMDEGLTEFFTVRFLWSEYHTDFYTNRKDSDQPTGIYTAYNHLCVSTQDNSSLFNAYAQNDMNNEFYQYVVKPVVPFMLFADMIGDEKFLFAFKEFVERWKGKHPTPFDLFYTMNDVLNENYNWFWNAWFMDFGYPDLGIEMQDNQVFIKRVGARALPLPVHLIIEYKDATSTVVSRSMDIWKNGEREITIDIDNLDEVKSVRLDDLSVPDINPGNNHVELN